MSSLSLIYWSISTQLTNKATMSLLQEREFQDNT